MRKITLLVTLIVTSIVTNAQSFFDTLEDMDGVDVVVVTKDAFEMISKFKNVKIEDNEAMQVFQMIQELKELKVFSTKETTIANKMDVMVSTAIKKHGLTEFMRVKNDDSRVKIYMKTGKNKDYVSEVLMFVKDIQKKTKNNVDSVIVSLTGNIDINKLSDLADTFSKKEKE